MSNGSHMHDGVVYDDEEYDYDYNASISYIPLEKAIPVGILYGLTFVLGCTGNFLVIFAISCYRRMKNITNTFLLSLASADLLLLISCVPVKFADFLTFTWVYGEVLCKGVHYIMDVTAVCSVTTLTVMSLERYYAILHPIKAKYTCTVSRARKATVGIWLASFILALPTIFIRYLELVGHKRKGWWCTKSWGDQQIYHQLYEVYILLIILVIPVSIMVFAYASICHELWAVSHQRSVMRRGEVISLPEKSTFLSNHDNDGRPGNARAVVKVKYSSEDDRTRKQVIKMLISIIVLFVICWSPIVINNVLVAFGRLRQYNHGFLLPMRQAFYLLAYANSCVNPIVYGFLSKNFRETFKHALCHCIKGRNYNRQMLAARATTRLTNMSTTCNRSDIEQDDFELHINRAVANVKLMDEVTESDTDDNTVM